MFGFKIGRVRDDAVSRKLPRGSIALFRRHRSIRRGDVVLVEHPDLGRVVRQVSVVGRRGNIHFKRISDDNDDGEAAGKKEANGKVRRDAVLGRLVIRLI